jgi:medium-chain acyl-[acyl-carrier-protein] hydrolase
MEPRIEDPRMDQPTASRWILHLSGPAPADARRILLCFSHAGGGPNAWRPLGREMPEDTATLAIRLPGRETRIAEAPMLRCEDAVSAIADAMEYLPRTPDMLLGHSMGSLIAYETVRELERRGLALPRILAVAGMRAPDLPLRRAPVYDAPAEAFVARLRLNGGTPSLVLDNPDMLRLFEPMLRADYQLYDTYLWQPGPPLGCAVVAFAGEEDAVCSVENVAGWRRHAGGAFVMKTFPGGHFFPHAKGSDFPRSIAALLDEPPPSGTGTAR